MNSGLSEYYIFNSFFINAYIVSLSKAYYDSV